MYESFFGLTGHPFRLIPDPSFLFMGRGHRDAFAALRAGLTAGARLMVLTGEVGAGKTTLLQALLPSVDPASTIVAHISAAHLDAETISERLSEALGLPRQPDPSAGRDALPSALARSPLATLLVIDEAQHLAPSALDLFETLASATDLAPSKLQICLVGHPELRILLNAPQRRSFRELIGVDRHLGPLEQAEVRLYVEHRLHRAGWAGRPEFEDAAFTEIFIFTAGNPRRINRLCDSLMLCAYLKKQQRIDASAVTWAAAAMREDAFQGAPDLLDLGSHFEQRPTLMEAFEPDALKAEATTPGEDIPTWSCSRCDRLNPARTIKCWNCEAARPGVHATAERQPEAIDAPEDPATVPPDAAPVDVSMDTGDDPALTMTDGTSQEVAAARSDPLAGVMRQSASAGRRRGHAILAIAMAAAVVLALLAYVFEQQGPNSSLTQKELRDIGANRTTTASRAPAVDPLRGAAGSVAPASSLQPSAPAPAPGLAGRGNVIEPPPLKSPQGGDSRSAGVVDEVPSAAGAAPKRVLPVTPAPPGTPTPSCSGSALALGLCDADSSSTRRQ